jgi:translocator protein
MKTQSLLIYVLTIGAALGAGALGSLFTADAIPAWYQTLAKPSWTPPNWVFGPVWTMLYILMGVAAGLVWQSGGMGRSGVLWFYFAHLVVNALWSVVFFGLQEIGVALFLIILLWVLIVIMSRLFGLYSRTARLLLIPYLLWVSYASAVNLAILVLN